MEYTCFLVSNVRKSLESIPREGSEESILLDILTQYFKLYKHFWGKEKRGARKVKLGILTNRMVIDGQTK